MKTITAFIICCLLTAAASAQYNLKNLFLETEANVKAFTYKNLSIYPVYAKQTFTEINKNVGNYTPLKEALQKNKLKITESEQGATVNTLYVQNISQDTVMILGGEVVQGGKQDRMIAQDIIIPPKSKKIDLSVYCVEHGRWTYQNSKGKDFNMSYTVPNTEVRKAGTVKKNQQEVWNKVADVTIKNKASSNTGTYSAMEAAPDYKKELAAYKAYFNIILKNKNNVIGFVAASGDKVLGCDLFATNDLFRNQLDNLISSYATEAITTGKKSSVSYSQVKGYLDNLLADETKQDKYIEQNGTQLKSKSSRLHIAVY